MSVEILLMSCMSVWLSSLCVRGGFAALPLHCVALRCVHAYGGRGSPIDGYRRLYEYNGIHAVGVWVLKKLGDDRS